MLFKTFIKIINIFSKTLNFPEFWHFLQQFSTVYCLFYKVQQLHWSQNKPSIDQEYKTTKFDTFYQLFSSRLIHTSNNSIKRFSLLFYTHFSLSQTLQINYPIISMLHSGRSYCTWQYHLGQFRITFCTSPTKVTHSYYYTLHIILLTKNN